MKKKNKYFFWWFSSSWNEKKKIDVKKKTLQEAGMSYCPFFFSKCESQYNKLYYDTRLDRHGLGEWPGRAAGPQGGGRGAHGCPRYDRLGHDTGHHTAKGDHDTAGSARARPG